MSYNFYTANKIKKYFLLIIISLITVLLGFIFINISYQDTDAKTTNNTYNFYVFGLGKSPQSYSESTHGIFSTNDFVATSSYNTSPGTFKVDVTITKNEGGGCSATPSGEKDAKTIAYAKGSSYAHGFTGQEYSYSVTYSVKPKSGYQVYYAGGMKLLNSSATSTDSIKTVEDIIAKKSKSFSNVSEAWSTSEQSANYTFSLGSHLGTSEVNNDYAFYWIFAPIRYTITYKVDNSTYSTKYVDFGTNYSLPSNPSKTGYEFLGWYNSSDQKITSSTIKSTASNETLTAKWRALSYRVNVNMINPLGEEDYKIGTFSQTYNSSTKDNLNDQYFSTMYMDEKMTITNIKPATGYKLVNVYTDYGTITNNNGTYTFTANFNKNPSGSSSWDATIKIEMAYNNYSVKINTDGGTYKNQISPTITTTYKQIISLSTPYKEGYIFDGWQNSSGAKLMRNQYFTQAQTFNGAGDYITIGRDKMYSDKITIAFNAYMDNWADYSGNTMRLISCTESGGWNFESSNGNILVSVYDKGSGYKNVTTSKAWSSLSSGWHSFVVTFDGVKAYLFVDNVFVGKSANFSSGLIGYNSSNSIFVGAEAGSSSTTPAGSPCYFKGKIQNLLIINDFVRTSNLSKNSDCYLLIDVSDVTIDAQWQTTWTVADTTEEFETGDGSLENPYQISSAEQLAYLSKMVYNGENFDGKYFELTDNIDLTAHYWQPIGIVYDRGNSLKNYSFNGNFNGNGHIINGLITYDGDTYAHTYQALFGFISNNAIVSNVILTNTNINGDKFIGGIVALTNSNSIVEKCYVYGSISGNSVVGGIVGYASENSTITNNINYSAVGGNSIVGGIVGQADATIVDCGVESSVNGSSNYGGIVGQVLSSGSVKNCYAISQMNSNKIYGTNQGIATNLVAVVKVGATENKSYIGSDFSGFVWVNEDFCPIPKNLVFIGEFAQNVSIEMLTQKGFVAYE